MPHKNLISNFILHEILDNESIPLTHDTPLVEIGIQSIEIMELVLFIERELNIKLPQEFVFQENIRTINTMNNFLKTLGTCNK